MTARRLRLDPIERRRPADERQSAIPTPAEAGGQPERGGAESQVRLVPAHLPGPIRRGRRRREVAVRQATLADAAACAQVDGRYTTTHVWQLDTRHEGDELRISFRQVRLPRELALDSPHRPPASRAGTLPRGLFWLVAEEVEVFPDSPDATRAAPRRQPAAEPGRAPQVSQPLWSHALRRTGGASTMQMSLPEQADAPAPPASTRAGTVVGYVASAMAPGSQNAYLSTLVVDRKYRRKGIATKLLAAAQRWAAAQGAVELMADIPARNYPALRLLQKAGFAFCGFNDRCYPDNEVALFFSYRLR